MGLAVCVECGTEGYYAEQAAASSPPGLFSTTSSEAAPHFSKKSHCEEAPAFNKERVFLSFQTDRCALRRSADRQ